MNTQVRIAVRVLPAMLALALISCSDPVKPVLPVWNVGLNVPFNTEKYTMNDVLGQNPNVRITPTSDSTFEALIEEGTFTDTIKMNLDEKTIENLRSVEEGIVVFEITNNTPATAVVETQFTDENYNPILIPQSASGLPFEIGPAEVSGDGSVIAPVKTKLEVYVTKDDIETMIKSQWLLLTMHITTPGSLPIVFTYSDYFKMVIYAHVDVKTEIGKNP